MINRPGLHRLVNGIPAEIGAARAAGILAERVTGCPMSPQLMTATGDARNDAIGR